MGRCPTGSWACRNLTCISHVESCSEDDYVSVWRNYPGNRFRTQLKVGWSVEFHIFFHGGGTDPEVDLRLNDLTVTQVSRPLRDGLDLLRLKQYQEMRGVFSRPTVTEGASVTLEVVRIGPEAARVRAPLFNTQMSVPIEMVGREVRVDLLIMESVQLVKVVLRRGTSNDQEWWPDKLMQGMGTENGREGKSDFACSQQGSRTRYCEHTGTCLDWKLPCQNETYGVWHLREDASSRDLRLDLGQLGFLPRFLTVRAAGDLGQVRLYDDSTGHFAKVSVVTAKEDGGSLAFAGSDSKSALRFARRSNGSYGIAFVKVAGATSAYFAHHGSVSQIGVFAQVKQWDRMELSRFDFVHAVNAEGSAGSAAAKAAQKGIVGEEGERVLAFLSAIAGLLLMVLLALSAAFVANSRRERRRDEARTRRELRKSGTLSHGASVFYESYAVEAAAYEEIEMKEFKVYSYYNEYYGEELALTVDAADGDGDECCVFEIRHNNSFYNFAEEETAYSNDLSTLDDRDAGDAASFVSTRKSGTMKVYGECKT